MEIDIQEDFINLNPEKFEDIEIEEDENDFPDIPIKENDQSEQLRGDPIL